MAKQKGHYSVRPRYTCGSPAMVDKATAERVAVEEQKSYERSCVKQGLFGIVEFLTERHLGWEVHDLLTGDVYLRPFANEQRDLDAIADRLNRLAFGTTPVAWLAADLRLPERRVCLLVQRFRFLFDRRLGSDREAKVTARDVTVTLKAT